MIMRILYYDCFSGISGDMNLGALIDLGVNKDYLLSELSKLKIDEYDISVRKDIKNGISGTKVDVILKKQSHNCENDKGINHDHHHHHNGDNSTHDHHHRNLTDIEDIINSSNLNENVKKISLGIFKKVAEAEAKVHDKPLNEVYFHEVGAVDSIVDIVGAAICFDYLKVDKVKASKVEVGHGFVRCSHGLLPIPAPATAEILQGIPIKASIPFEATTPTGAAILSYLVSEFTSAKNFKISKIGYGIGDKDNDDIPNVLRVFLGEEVVTDKSEIVIDEVAFTGSENYLKGEAEVIECNIDDMNPEIYEYVMELLFEKGALDVYLTPIIMKKGRPGIKLNILHEVGCGEPLKDIILRETTTLGFRRYRVQRNMLKRDFTKVATRYGEITVKNAYYKGRKIKSKPEYEECKKIAIKNSVSINEIYKEVISQI